jgi:uncharacterized protein YijF (DUF1287 family)
MPMDGIRDGNTGKSNNKSKSNRVNIINGKRSRKSTAVAILVAILIIAVLFLAAKYIKNIMLSGSFAGIISQNRSQLQQFEERIYPPKVPVVKVERILSGSDKDSDGVDDLDDIVRGARAEAERAPTYKSAYYREGYPPEDEGVCTDVIWRAFKDAGYDLKKMVDGDIANNIAAYPRVNGKPDPNIDFRRVPNLTSYFKRHADILTTKISPGDKSNLELWQGGDIVVFGSPAPHVAIISDKRRRDGVPLLIHNAGPYAKENDCLLYWTSPITYHFRYPKSK